MNAKEFVSAADRANPASLATAVRDHRAGRLREAVSGYEALLARTPDDADLLQLLGVALAQLGRHAEGAALLARSLELQPDRATVLLNLAQALHTLGREEEALRSCDRALALDQSLAAGYRTRAAVLTALGRHDEALANAGQAVRLALQDAGSHADLGGALAAVGREREAVECFERATSLDPNLAAAHHNLAVLLTRQGQHERALHSFERALALQPHKPALHAQRGNAFKALERLPEAAESYSLGLALEPGNPEILHNRAVVYSLLGRHAEALRDFDALAAKGKESGPDLVGRGAALVALRRYHEALAPLERATELLPGEAEAHIQRGVALLNVERHAEAVESFDRALALRPDVPEVLTNRGIALKATGRLSEALGSFIRSSVLNGTADSHINIGILLKILGRHREAAGSFDRALTLDPTNSAARFALAFLYLSLGEFALGWPLYEARFDIREFGNPRRSFNVPRWHGSEPLAGRALLVHAEQGLGDVMQFCRYLPLLAAQGATIVFEVMPSLKALLRTLPGAMHIIGRGEPIPAVDYYCPLLSLPHALNTRIDTIPAQVPYLAAEPERVARWQERLGTLRGLRVGLAWQGNPKAEEFVWARGRSLPLAALEPLAQLPDVSLVSLQKGPGCEQLPRVPFADRIVELGTDLDAGPDAFLDTAAVMASLDLVVSCDTAIVHLAGALGRPVWTALSLSPEWRWLLARNDSPWYPTMRLFRQSADGDWGAVVTAMVQALAPLAAQRAGNF